MNESEQLTTVQTLAGMDALLDEIRDVAHQVAERAQEALNRWPAIPPPEQEAAGEGARHNPPA